MFNIKTSIITIALCWLLGGANWIYGQNVLYTQTFGNCEWPSDWTTEVQVGATDWFIQDNIRTDPDYGDNCFLHLLDNDNRGQNEGNIWVYSPWVTPINADSIFIDFLFSFIKVDGRSQTLDIYYEQGGTRHLFMHLDSSLWGATFNDYAELRIAVENTMQEPLRLSFNYINPGTNSGAFSAVSIDNVIFHGFENSVCEEAVDLLEADQFCVQGNNHGINPIMVTDACDGVQTTRPTWYRYVSPKNGFIKITTEATFNDIVDVFYGRCDDLIPFRCSNEDEYGFTGEAMYLRVTEGVNYYIRISAYDSPFAPPVEGEFCIDVQDVPGIPAADAYDNCSGALAVELDGDCVEASTYFAETTDPSPTLNEKSRADVWFSYFHSTSDPITIRTNADFADVITIYSGNCFFPSEVTGTDQGPELVGIELKDNTQYFIKVSGYFSTIEGDLCLSVETASTAPENDNCDEAISLVLDDQNCVDASTVFARTSGIKSSCQIKPSPDVWYEFTVPQSGDIAIEVNADFIYDIALYTGECDSLIEVRCGFNPHRCEGYVNYENLDPGSNIKLQLSSHLNAFGHVRGDVCVSVYDLENAPLFEPLKLEAEVTCLFGSIGVLDVATSGGVGTIEVTGNQTGDWLLPGEPYLVIAEDESGCRQIANGTGRCTEGFDCDSSGLELIVTLECELDDLGLQTGRSIVKASIEGAVGQTEIEGNKNGDIVENGDLVRIAVRDESGCVKYYVATASCDPFTCDESTLAITADYTCIDSLLRARLNISANEGNGQYSFSGNLDGELLEHGDTFLSVVTDEAGCVDSIYGQIDCNFDSCAFSALDIQIDYECLTDNEGNQTGEAVLMITTDGGIGNLTFVGGNDGDTLFNGQTYNIEVIDEWGCSVIRSGVIECTPTSTRDIGEIPGLKAFPNPASNNVMISLEGLSAEDISIEVIDNSGKMHRELSYQSKVGTNIIPLYCGDLPRGVYHLKVLESGRTGIIRLILQ